MQTITANIVFIEERKIAKGTMSMSGGKIISLIVDDEADASLPYLLPGFVDSHVHIESSMLVPSEFAKMAVVHGTVATISDPHEIANVCGMEGVKYMIDNGKKVPFKFHFGAPSCVPATVFETAGATLGIDEVKELLQRDDIFYLSEMMNFPGVLNNDTEVLAKINAAKELNKPIDGHAPGLKGELAEKYIAAGISTDHECFTKEEALHKLKYGMKILIREGSAAKNFDALIPLLDEHYEQMMFCSDDKHPDSLLDGHINQLCARAVAAGVDVFKVLQAACINPVKHYKMQVGMLREGEAADFILVKDLENFQILFTFIDGKMVADNGKSLINTEPAPLINQFNCEKITVSNIEMTCVENEKEIPVIVALNGQLITQKSTAVLKPKNGKLESDIEQDVLKIVVINRYKPAKPAIAFIKNFGMKQGAIAGSVAHDSHNILAVGCTDESIIEAINLVIEQQGGISCVSNNNKKIIGLPVAGLMSNRNGYEIADEYIAIDKMAKEGLGSTLQSPFMTLSFMALLVIPSIKLSDLGLFDGDSFSFIES